MERQLTKYIAGELSFDELVYVLDNNISTLDIDKVEMVVDSLSENIRKTMNMVQGQLRRLGDIKDLCTEERARQGLLPNV